MLLWHDCHLLLERGRFIVGIHYWLQVHEEEIFKKAIIIREGQLVLRQKRYLNLKQMQ